jgi:hypothetical protein
LELTFCSGNFVPNFLWSSEWSYSSHKIHTSDALVHRYPCPTQGMSRVSCVWMLLERIHFLLSLLLMYQGKQKSSSCTHQKGYASALPIDNHIQDYWVSGLCRLSSTLKECSLSDTGSDFIRRWGIQWLRLYLSNEHNRIGASASFHQRTETDMVSKMLCCFRIWWWMKSRNLIMLNARHHYQTPRIEWAHFNLKASYSLVSNA